jgi:hypothetical protein
VERLRDVFLFSETDSPGAEAKAFARTGNIYLEPLQGSAARNQLDDQHHDSDHQDKVNEAACDVKTEAQNPQQQKDYKDRPKHVHLLEHNWSARHSGAWVGWMQN